MPKTRIAATTPRPGKEPASAEPEAQSGSFKGKDAKKHNRGSLRKLRFLGKLRTGKKNKSFQQTVFTAPLDEAPVAPDLPEVPIVLRILTEYIESTASATDEIYSTESSVEAIAVRKQIEDDPGFWPSSNEECDASTASTIVLSWLRECQDDFGVHISRACTSTSNDLDTPNLNLVPIYKESLSTLPSRIVAVLAWLTRHCNTLTIAIGSSALHLAEAIGSSAGLTTELLLLLIANSEEIFSNVEVPGGPCLQTVYKSATAEIWEHVRSQKSSPVTIRRLSKAVSKFNFDEGLPVKQDQLESEVRMMEMSLDHHREGMRVAAEKNSKYPAKQLDEMLAIQRRLTSLKRLAKAAKETNETKNVELSTKDFGLQKQLQELQLQKNELNKIQQGLSKRIDAERKMLESYRAQLDEQNHQVKHLKESDDELFSLLASEQATYDAHFATQNRLCEELTKERNECAAIRVQINVMTASKGGIKDSRACDYSCDTGSVTASEIDN